MPNWCSTSYIFESTNRDVLKRFYDFVIKYKGLRMLNIA